MKVEILTMAADPDRTLIRGKVYDLPDAEAKGLIEAKAARKIAEKDIKPRHTPPQHRAARDLDVTQHGLVTTDIYVPYADVTPVAPRPADVPAVAAVTVDQVKHQARVDTSAEDTLLELHVAASIEAVQLATGHYLGQTALDAYLPYWPQYGAVYLPGGNVQRVVEIRYRDEDGAEAAWDAANWELQRFPTRSSVRRVVDGEFLPTGYHYAGGPYLYGGRLDRYAVRVRYVAGYASVDDIPVGLRQAALMVAAELYIDREAHRTQPGVIAIANPAAEMLMSAHKIRWPA